METYSATKFARVGCEFPVKSIIGTLTDLSILSGRLSEANKKKQYFGLLRGLDFRKWMILFGCVLSVAHEKISVYSCWTQLRQEVLIWACGKGINECSAKFNQGVVFRV